MWFGLTLGQKMRINRLEKLVTELTRSFALRGKAIENYKSACKKLKRALYIAHANTAGCDAVISAFRKQHPDSPLNRNVGVYTTGDLSGRPKPAFRLVFQKAFDESIRESLKEDPRPLRSE